MKTYLFFGAIAFATITGSGFFWAGSEHPLKFGDNTQRTTVPDPKKITWTDLLPEGESFVMPWNAGSDFPDVRATPFTSSETGDAGELGIPLTPLPESGRQDLANQFVKLAGYMTPLNVEQGKTRMFLLVPYVGACIHVPAPPANQIVLVESKTPIEVRRMWEPFEAVGTLQVKTLSTQLADVSYKMDLNRIEPYVAKPSS